MQFTEIETFRALMRMGTTHKAAQLLGVTQPAVSQSIKRLQSQSGITLFQRRAARLMPTPEAHGLMAEVERAFIGMDAIAHRISSLRQGGVGRMEVSCYPAFGLGFMPRALGRFQQHLCTQPGQPWPQVSLQILSSKDVRERVSMGLCDFGLMADELPLQGIDHSSFARMKGVVVMPPGHALARFQKVTPRQLAEARFISLNPEDASRRRLDAALAALGLSVQVALHTPYAASVCELALNGLGIGLVNPITALDYVARGLVIRRFAIDVEFVCVMVLPAGKVLSGTAQSFLSVMRHQLADDEQQLGAFAVAPH